MFIIQEISHAIKIHTEVIATHRHDDWSEQNIYDGSSKAATRASADTVVYALVCCLTLVHYIPTEGLVLVALIDG